MTNQHVVRRVDGWAVRGEGHSRDTSHHSTQREAMSAAKDIASNQGGDAIVHGRDGQIRERNTYGKVDRFPPRG